jgi:hypothetical protein
MSVLDAEVGTSAAASAASATMLVATALIGTSAAAVSATAPAKVAQAIAGSSASASSATAFFAGAEFMGTSAAAASAFGLMDVAVGAVGSGPSASTASAAMTLDAALIGASPSASAATAPLHVDRVHSGVSAASTGASGVLGIGIGLTGTAPTGAFAGGGLNAGDSFFMGTSAVGASASAVLRVTQTLVSPLTILGVLQRFHTPRLTGDTRPFVVKLVHDSTGLPVDLGGATATFKLISDDLVTVIVSEAIADIDDVTGTLSYAPYASDVAVGGNYIGRFEVTFSSGVLHAAHCLYELVADI